jgi:4-hydroxy-tetrahydrodipicolinate reductase
MIRVAVAGAAGRMGTTTCAAVAGAEDMRLAGRADPALGVELDQVLGDADVVVDFTRPDQAVGNARACVEAGVHAVIGTTGWDEADLRAAVARGGANVFAAPNFAC